MKISTLYRSRKTWTQGAMARNARGRVVLSRHPNAVTWCFLGAIERCYGHHPETFQAILQRVTKFLDFPIVPWNDDFNRTFADIKALARRLKI